VSFKVSHGWRWWKLAFLLWNVMWMAWVEVVECEMEDYDDDDDDDDGIFGVNE